jgi:hypothetical protein
MASGVFTLASAAGAVPSPLVRRHRHRPTVFPTHHPHRYQLLPYGRHRSTADIATNHLSNGCCRTTADTTTTPLPMEAVATKLSLRRTEDWATATGRVTLPIRATGHCRPRYTIPRSSMCTPSICVTFFNDSAAVTTAVTTTTSHNPDSTTSTTATTTASTASGSTEKPPPFPNPPFNAVSADYTTVADPFSGEGLRIQVSRRVGLSCADGHCSLWQ